MERLRKICLEKGVRTVPTLIIKKVILIGMKHFHFTIFRYRILIFWPLRGPVKNYRQSFSANFTKLYKTSVNHLLCILLLLHFT